jgi:hypothetical protein
MPEMICPYCLSWRFMDQDRYCGCCGKSLLVAEASIQPAFVYVDQQIDEIELSIANAGSGSLEGSEIGVRSTSSGTVAYTGLIPEGELCSNDGSRYRVMLRVRDLLQDGQPQRWEVLHRAELHQDRAPQSDKEDARILGHIQVNLPVPLLELADDALSIEVADPEQPTTLSTELVVRLLSQADGAEVQNVHCEAPAEQMPVPIIEAGARTASLEHTRDWILPLHLSTELTRLLVNRPAGVEFNLVVSFRGREAQEQICPIRIPFTLHVPTPARPLLALLNERYVGMAGSDIRIQAQVHNRGGEPCRLSETEIQLRKGPDALRSLLIKTPGRGEPIPADSKRMLEVAVPLIGEDGTDLSGQLFELEWTQSFEDLGASTQRRKAIVEVRRAEPFDGILAVDFGTTATAVAVVPNGKPIPHMARLGERTEYLPTAILYYLDDEQNCRWLIGDQAQRALAETGDDYKFYYDNLKLHLLSNERQLLPDGRERSWAGIAADYLGALRRRLEGDPTIAAMITDVYPTHPATFPPLATDALLGAYRQGGMKPRAYRLRSGGSVVMSESWPQVLLRLPLPQLGELRRRAFGKDEIPSEDPQRFGLISFDVGGGTTDMSLFQVDVRSYAEIDIEEIITDSDFSFSGNGIANLLAASILRSCDAWFENNGLSSTNESAPFVLPWDDRDLAATTAVQLDNGRAIAALARRLQDNAGPLRDLRNLIENSNEAVRRTARWTTVSKADSQDDESWKDVCEAWASVGQQIAEQWPLRSDPPRLRLRLERGSEVEIPWGTDGLHLDLGEFYQAFATELVDPLNQRMRLLFEQAKERDLDIFLMVTGRGSLFPAVEQILYELAQIHYELKRVSFLGASPEFLKDIVAYGTGLLGRITRYAHDIVFKPLSLAKLCVAAGLDPRTGKQRLIEVTDGMPTLEDGRCISREPIRYPPGDGPRTVELFLSPRFDGLLDFDRDKRLISFTRELEFEEADALRVYLVVERRPPDCLHVWLAWPAGSITEQPDDDWQWAEMGQYTDSEDGCVSTVSSAEQPAPKNAIVVANLDNA